MVQIITKIAIAITITTSTANQNHLYKYLLSFLMPAIRPLLLPTMTQWTMITRAIKIMIMIRGKPPKREDFLPLLLAIIP